MSRYINAYVKDELAERLSGSKGSADDLRSEIERLDHDFDFDGFAPYSHQESEVISELEDEHWRDAQDIADSGQTFKPSEWEQARRAYAAALAYTAFSSLWETAKHELIEAIEQFESDAESIGCEEPIISLSMTCLHGWASHDREDEQGTMFFVSRQLDGANGLAREIDSVWLSVCF